MTKAGSNTERLYTLLGDLSPELLATAFPEGAGNHNAISFRARHAGRIGKMIALYAACAVIFVGAVMFVPKLMSLLGDTPVADPNATTVAPNNDETPLDYPADYFRPDLVWANENADPRRENAVEGRYHAIDFEFSEDDSAVYAVYMKYFNGEHLTNYSQDFGKKSGANFERLAVSSDDQYRILEDSKARYYAGTRQQIEAYFNYIEKTYQTEDDAGRIRICLAYQTLKPGIINGRWNPDLLHISTVTGFSSTIPYPGFVKCIQGSTSTPVIRPDAKNITFTFSLQEHSDSITTSTHTVSYQPQGPDLAILINGTWYDIPWTAPVNSKEAKLEIPENGEASFTLPFADFPHGELPVGQYRFIFPFKGEHTLSDGTVAKGEQTHTVLFMVTTGDDCISTGASQGLAYTLLEDGTYSVSTSAYLNTEELVIPAVYCGIPVTEIGDYAFNSRTSITSVTLPNTIRSIGTSAFYWCTSLKTINLPNSITEIKREAFSSCNSLEEIVIPNSITRLEYGVFDACHEATRVIIPDSVTYIGERALNNCYSLTDVTIPASVQYIGEYAFSSCSRLRSITFEDPENWLSAGGPIDLSAPTENAQWLVHTAGELTRGTAQDYIEAARWSIEDANWNTPLTDWQSITYHYYWFDSQNDGYYIVPWYEDPDFDVQYHFYGIADNPENPDIVSRAMIVMRYEDEAVKAEGMFYVHTNYLRSDSVKTVEETGHDGLLRTYTIYVNGVVLADISITAKDPGQSDSDQYHLLAVNQMADALKQAH